MPGTFEYCLINNGLVENIIIIDEAFSSEYATLTGKTVLPHRAGVTIGDKYHDGKFWRTVKEYCEGGMTHEGETEPCPGGEILLTTHEEEIV